MGYASAYPFKKNIMEDILIFIYLFFEKFFSLFWVIPLFGGVFIYYNTGDLVVLISMITITIMLLLLKVPKVKNKIFKLI